MSYRFDIRTKEEFKKDIKEHHISEAEIAVRLCVAKYFVTNKWPKLVPNGTDSTGNFVENNKNVTHTPDFIIDGKYIEITRSDRPCKRSFHQKIAKVNKCVKENYIMIFVNGLTTFSEPPYIAIDGNTLKEKTDKAIKKYGEVSQLGRGNLGPIGKAAYRYDLDWFDDMWLTLPPLIEEIPKIIKI
jgi:hypothetical protein